MGVTYIIENEELLFENCDELFGLSNSKPLKNRQLSISRINNISKLLIDLPLQIVIIKIDLSNQDLKRIVTLHEELGNLMRKEYRKVRERPVAQILYTQTLHEVFFRSIIDFSKTLAVNSQFDILIDSWSIPSMDRELYLEETAQSLEEKINQLHKEFKFDFNIKVSPIELLEVDSKRKRFIDIITSSISRSFYDDNNYRFTDFPITNVLSVESNTFNNITSNVVEFIDEFMNVELRRTH